MSWLPWRRKREEESAPDGRWRQPGLEEVSSALQNSLRRVGEAVEKCSVAQASDLAGARRELAGELRESVAMLDDLVRDVAPSSRIHRMARLTAQQLVDMSQLWLVLGFLVTDRSALTSEETSELQRRMLTRAEELIKGAADARGDELVAAREGLRQLVNEVEVFSSAVVVPPMSERKALMWRIAFDEIAGFVREALGRGSEQPGPH